MTGTLKIGDTIGQSVPEWQGLDPEASPDAPNILVVLLDDVGFASYGCFGSSIDTPNIDRLAREGLRYTNFHTTPLCSPTRASLLTGRNSHAVGFGHVTERLAGFPGYSMRLPDSAATVARVLRDAGWSTWCVGKWHLTPSYEYGPQGPYARWPLGRGFDRFYGFLGGSTDQFHPELVRDNTPLSVPEISSEGYHLTQDLADEIIGLVSDHVAMAPLRPFFCYFTPGACHTPHQAPPAWLAHYRGRFDDGWDVERERVLARQLELGVVPPGTELAPPNPGVHPWADLGSDEQRLYARMMEAYAAFLSHTDEQLGRVLEHLDRVGVADNTVVLFLADNGASAEGGPSGSVDEGLYINDRPQTVADGLAHIDRIGGPDLYNHYPWGWAQAMNTPFPWYKQFTHAGGITNGLIVRWPAGSLPAGELRTQYHHVVDIAPTILDIAGVPQPTVVSGTPQQRVDGVSFAYTFLDQGVESRRTSQYYEMWGNRGFYRDGWMAVCRLQPDAPGNSPQAPMRGAFDELPWELYDHRTDPTEIHDLAAERPDVLASLVEGWWVAARENNVLPIDDRPRRERWPVDPPVPPGSVAGRTVFHGPGGPYARGAAPGVYGRSFTLTADLEVTGATPTGVLYQLGGRHGGYCWYLADGKLGFEVSQASIHTETVSTSVDLTPGRHRLSVAVDAIDEQRGRVTFTVDGTELLTAPVTGLLRILGIGSSRTWVGRCGSPTVSGAVTPELCWTGGALRRLEVELGAPAPKPTSLTVAATMREQ